MLNPSQRRAFAAIFVDFENLFYFFKNEFLDPPNLNDAVFETLRNLRERLKNEFSTDAIVINAYADFEKLPASPQGQLFLLGIDTKNVLGTEHKNAADMRLCIDAMEVLYTRPQIDTFVLVAGDRDYIPLIQHLRRQAKNVLGTGFYGSTSGDLRLNLGEDSFIDARSLVEMATWERLENHRKIAREVIAKEDARLAEQRQRTQTQRVPSPVPSEIRSFGKPVSLQVEPHLERPAPSFGPLRDLEDEDELVCLRLIVEKIQEGHFSELWLGPFLRDLTDEMPHLADYQRRRLITDLTRTGSIAVEKREGDPFPFSVIVLNYNHPAVKDLSH